jgi:hypothetical protein
VKALLALLAIVFAATITITPVIHQAEFGSTLSIVPGLLATDKGFNLAPASAVANGTSCSSPIIFGPSPGTANTTITTGDLVFDVQVNQTSGATPSHPFNVTLFLGTITYGPLCVQTISSPVDGETIDCRFDVGQKLPPSPYAFKVTVQ